MMPEEDVDVVEVQVRLADVVDVLRLERGRPLGQVEKLLIPFHLQLFLITTVFFNNRVCKAEKEAKRSVEEFIHLRLTVRD